MKKISESATTVRRLKDYKSYPWNLDQCFLDFALDSFCTRVNARLTFSAKNTTTDPVDLVLDGDQIKLHRILLDGIELHTTDYHLDAAQLVVPADLVKNRPSFVVETSVDIHPADNKALEGLYQSGSILCSQCEAEGFRRITYFPDRPDVMTCFDVRIQGNKVAYPLLLSNGNLIDSGDLGDDHFTLWHDPFKKPCYLFALVAGDLATREDYFITMNARKVSLRIHTEKHNLDKTYFAMESLKKAMEWDERRFGREYDLDLFQIVVVDDFNSGAMENKSLNIFNSECVLASQETTVDSDYETIESVVAHEYFHNWSGNRVTLRDWFQLSLKEGFTVYRDALFTADNRSAAIKRINDAQLICSAQFAEDASPIAHPVRPASYTEIRNFYTLTVYEKGAEVIGMLETLLGWRTFRKGCDEYFRRHDGQAVRVEDFIAAMETVSKRSLEQFMLWYTQAGTPSISITDEYDQHTGCYRLHLCQSLPQISSEEITKPMLIPIRIACLSSDGELLALDETGTTETLLELTNEKHTYNFYCEQRPMPSLLRKFSAPVNIEYNYDNEQLALLLRHDTDLYSRWSAGQELKSRIVNRLIAMAVDGNIVNGSNFDTNPTVKKDLQRLVEIYANLIELCLASEHDSERLSESCLLLSMPTRLWLEGKQKVIHVEQLNSAVRYLGDYLGINLSDLWNKLYQAHRLSEAYSPDYRQAAVRRIKNMALMYLLRASEEGQELAWQQFNGADNMTDSKAALELLVSAEPAKYADQALAEMYQKWQHEPLVVNQWLEVQAGVISPNTLDKVISLLDHPAFDIENPNKVRSLIGVYTRRSYIGFHRKDGAGYQWFCKKLLQIDSFNAQMAARLATPLARWRRYQHDYAIAMKQQLAIIQQSNISNDLQEVVDKSLAVTD